MTRVQMPLVSVRPVRESMRTWANFAIKYSRKCVKKLPYCL